MKRALYMLDNYGYIHTLRICNTDFCSTTVGTRTYLSVTEVHRPPSPDHALENLWANVFSLRVIRATDKTMC